MAEEHRCQAPKLCANNCGFFGSPATLNLCSKCYRDLQLKEQQSSNAKLVLNQSLTTAVSSAAEAASSSFIHEALLSVTEVEAPEAADEVNEEVSLSFIHEALVSAMEVEDFVVTKEVNEEASPSFIHEALVSATEVGVPVAAEEVKEETRTANRCMTCRRRVGLTGFKCRCGITFCGTHRYPEQHGCQFDFKAVGRDEIKRSNPVIKAEKLNKI